MTANEPVRQGRVVAEVVAYADQFAAFAAQVRGLPLADEDLLTVQMTSDGTLLGVVEGHPEVVVTKDVVRPPTIRTHDTRPAQ